LIKYDKKVNGVTMAFEGGGGKGWYGYLSMIARKIYIYNLLKYNLKICNKCKVSLVSWILR